MNTYNTLKVDWLSRWHRCILSCLVFICAQFFLANIFFASLAFAVTYDVDTITDDAALSACDPVTVNDCSLRGAIIAASQDIFSDTINLPSGRYELTSRQFTTISSETNAANVPEIGDLDIDTDIFIVGAGPADTIISGRTFYTETASRIFHLLGEDTDVTIRNVTVEGGYHENVDSGSLIYNNAGGLVVLQNIVLRDSVGLGGGPIVNRSNSGTMHIKDASILSHYGSNTGAIRNTSVSGSTNGPALELTNVTIASTSQGSYPNNKNGTIRVDTGVVTLTNVTLFNNRYGLDVYSATVTLQNTLLVDNGDDITGRNCRGPILSGGGNYSSDGTCTAFTQPGDVNRGGDPGMSDMTYVDGQIVVPLYADSLVLDTASANCPATDQIDIARSVPCTPGAYEASVPRPTLSNGPMLQANTIQGIVFRDFDADGTRDLREPAVPDVTVTAVLTYTVMTTTADSRGFYTFTIPDGTKTRLEFSGWPSYLQAGAVGTDSATTLRFVNSPTNSAHLALQNPGQYCQENPNLATSCYVKGVQDGDRDVLVSFPFDAGSGSRTDGSVIAENGFTNDGNPQGPWAYDLPAHPSLANDTEIGSTWGLAYQRTTDTLFAAAFLKRHAGFGPNGPGAIYQIRDVSGTSSASLFTDLGSAAGADPHGTAADFPTDSASWGQVGKLGLGDMDISEADEMLYVINLADRALYQIPISSPTAMISTIIPLDLPGADQGCLVDDVRPFAVAVQDGQVYIGMVCSAESTQLSSNLRAYVYSYDPTNQSFGTLPALEFGLDYNHGHALTYSYPLAGTWHPWTQGDTVPAELIDVDQDNRRRAVYPQPMLIDIEFVQGDMVLAFADRLGHQAAPSEDLPNGNSSTEDDNIDNVEPAGDLLRACLDNSGQWVLEQNGQCGDLRSAGSNNGQGPGDGEFYFQDEMTGYHPEVTSGGVVQVPGRTELAYIAYDPILWARDLNSMGVQWANNDYGTWQRAYRIYDSVGANQATFAKSNGLGDLEALCMVAPIEIGNRVWLDANRDGIQDVGEAPIAGVTVNLYGPDGTTLLATALTDNDGHYLFSSNPYGSSTSSRLYNIAALRADQNGYRVRLDSPADHTTGPLVDYILARADQDSSANDNLRDSDGLLVNGYPEIIVNTGQPGANNHSYDFGFHGLDLAIQKIASTDFVMAGEILTYTLRYSETAGNSIQQIIITEQLPTGVTFLGQVRNSPSAVLDSSDVTQPVWTVATLSEDIVGEIVFRVQVAASYSGQLTNTVIISTANSAQEVTSVNNRAVENTSVLSPLLLLEKQVNGITSPNEPGPFIQANSAITWTYIVTNSGNITLTDLAVIDSDPVVIVSCPYTLLAPANSMTCSANGAARVGHYMNRATVTGRPLTANSTMLSANAQSHYFGSAPSLEILKLPDGQTIIQGGIATFDILVRNTGNVMLTDVMVQDPLAPECQRSNLTLAAGEDMQYRCTLANVTANFINQAQVSGSPPIGEPITVSDTAQVYIIANTRTPIPPTSTPTPSSTPLTLPTGTPTPILTPTPTKTSTAISTATPTPIPTATPPTTINLHLAKLPDIQTIGNGETAHFTILLHNQSTVPLTNIVVTDPLAADCDHTIPTLAAGGILHATCSLDNVEVPFTNVITAIGQSPTGLSIQVTDSARVEIVTPETIIQELISTITLTSVVTETVIETVVKTVVETITEPITVFQDVPVLQFITVSQVITQLDVITVPYTVLISVPVTEIVTVPHMITITKPITVTESITMIEQITMLQDVPVLQVITVSQVITQLDVITVPYTVLISVPVTEIVTVPHMITITKPITVTESITMIEQITVLQDVPVLQFITVSQLITQLDVITVPYAVPISVPVTEIVTVPHMITITKPITVAQMITVPEVITEVIREVITQIDIITITDIMTVPEFITISYPVTTHQTITVPVMAPVEIVANVVTITEIITEVITAYITATQIITVPQQPIVVSDIVSGMSTIALPEISLETANLTLQQSDGGMIATPGLPLVYILSYANLGSLNITGAVITETIPFYTQFDSALSSNGWSCPDGISGGMVCTFEIGEVLANEHDAISFVVTVDDARQLDGVYEIYNQAMISDVGRTNIYETTYSDNQDQTFTALAMPTALESTLEEGRYWHYLPLITR